jgi:hypothetical protein
MGELGETGIYLRDGAANIGRAVWYLRYPIGAAAAGAIVLGAVGHETADPEPEQARIAVAVGQCVPHVGDDHREGKEIPAACEDLASQFNPAMVTLRVVGGGTVQTSGYEYPTKQELVEGIPTESELAFKRTVDFSGYGAASGLALYLTGRLWWLGRGIRRRSDGTEGDG